MPKFVIERDFADVGKLSEDELKTISRTARDVIMAPGTEIQWLYSFVTENKTYCVYIAPDEEILRTRSEAAGFPTTRISRVTSTIDPTTAE